MAAEFDTYADRYYEDHAKSIAFSGEGPEFFSEYKVRQAALAARSRGIEVIDLLDFGAGIGSSVPYFRQFFPDCHIILADASGQSLDIATARHPGAEQKIVIDPEGVLPFADGQFDLCFTACVFHHIEHARHRHWLQELRRVTRQGGLGIVFEHNPLNPLTRHAVRTCPFDANARLVSARQLRKAMQAAAWREIQVRFHVFFPRVLSVLRPLEAGLAKCPLGGQYSVGACK